MAKARTPKADVTAAAPAPALHAYKGFDRDLSCRDFKYEIGGTYSHSGAVVRCAAGGFHSCEMPLDVWSYYGPATSRFAEVEARGSIDRNPEEDSKIASAEITIKAELALPDFIKRAVDWVLGAAKERIVTGDGGHAAATGYGGHAAATGKNAIAASLGWNGTACAREGGAIALAEHTDDGALVAVFASMVGQNGIEPGSTYRLRKGKPERVEGRS